MKKQFEKLDATGDGSVEDFPWDMNFYTCSIFFLDRFYFIPYRLDENIRVFRHRQTKQVLAFYAEPLALRRDGQLDGVNGVHDPAAVRIGYREDEDSITGCPISPTGLLTDKCTTLRKTDWELVLQKGDILLGTHIPGGPGYTPDRLKSSLQWAADFFSRYFPEIPFKGFGSESWLYDPHLRLLLKEDSHIVQMQNQMYIYPIESGRRCCCGSCLRATSTQRRPTAIPAPIRRRGAHGGGEAIHRLLHVYSPQRCPRRWDHALRHPGPAAAGHCTAGSL